MNEITFKALDEKDAWQTALKAPIPVNASLELLGKIRENVIGFLNYYSNDAPYGVPPDIMRTQINEAADRLYEICVAMQSAQEMEGNKALDDLKAADAEVRRAEVAKRQKNRRAPR